MQLQDSAVIVHSQPYAERDRIVTAFSREHGMVHGLLKQYARQRDVLALDVGVVGDMHWQARLPEHLGMLKFESTTNYSALWLHDRVRLCMLASACALVRGSFAMQDAHPAVFDGLLELLNTFREPDTHGLHARAYIAFECALLEEAGYGLDLSCCAATGARDNLRYVSPKSGRAVSAVAGEPYAKRLLPLPEFMREERAPDTEMAPNDIADGLKLTGYFIAHSLQESSGKDMPISRIQLSTMFA